MAALGVSRIWGKASQPSTPVKFAVPSGACDCHTHIVGERARFQFSERRIYTPEAALPEEMAALHRALHVDRVVIVTPSFYGTDNRATLWGMKARGRNARGVAVIDEETPETDLDEMKGAGIRGIRLNLTTGGSNDPGPAREMLRGALTRVMRLGWHVQMNTNLEVIRAVRDLVESAASPVVFDHFGGALGAAGTRQAGWSDLLALVKSGKAYVKLSGAYTVSSDGPDYPEMAPFARELVQANPRRVLWGSDWPHTSSLGVKRAAIDQVTPFTVVDDGRLFNQLAVWVPDAVVRRQILVENPARLYGF
jgi:predicted TIM-barrel fold metal-dependent hydrolase